MGCRDVGLAYLAFDNRVEYIPYRHACSQEELVGIFMYSERRVSIAFIITSVIPEIYHAPPSLF